MQEIKINHQKRWDGAGTVYQRGFNITKEVYSDFLSHLEKEKKSVKDYYIKLYLNAPITQLGKCFFLNLTQTDLFIHFMRKNKLSFNEKRANLKANGYLVF